MPFLEEAADGSGDVSRVRLRQKWRGRERSGQDDSERGEK
jgi:hypothetical protein